MDTTQIRTLFPVTQTSVYLNNAAESPMNIRVRQRLEEYLTLASEAPHKKPAVRQPVRAALAGLQSSNIEIVSPVENESERSAIIAFTLGSETANKALQEKLMANKILTALRDGRIRVSPNFFNTEDEIDSFLAVLTQ